MKSPAFSIHCGIRVNPRETCPLDSVKSDDVVSVAQALKEAPRFPFPRGKQGCVSMGTLLVGAQHGDIIPAESGSLRKRAHVVSE